MTPWHTPALRTLRTLTLLSLLLAVALSGTACKTQATQNAETKEEQKKESQEGPKSKGKSDFTIQTRTIAGVPQSLDEFKKLHAAEATTPEGTSAVFVAALLAVSQKVPGADQMVALTLTSDQVQNGALGTQAKERFIRGIGDRPNVASSYVKGASPSNGYKLPAPPFTIEIHRDPTDTSLTGDAKRVFVWSSGTDSPRPLDLRRQDSGIWLVQNGFSLTSDVARK